MSPVKSGGDIVVSSSANLQKMLEDRIPQLRELVPEGLDPRRLIKTALIQRANNPLISKATPASIIKSVITAAEIGLDCSGGVLGHAYLVPFKNKSGHYEAQLIPGYRGLMHLVRRASGLEIEAHCVFEGDEFVHYREYGAGKPGEFVKHAPTGDRSDDSKITHAYAVAIMKDGRIRVEVMTRDQIEAVRSISKQPNGMLWKDHFHEAARKTVVRRLVKWQDMVGTNTRLAKAIEADDTQFTFDPDNVIGPGPDDPVEPEGSPTERLTQKIKQANGDADRVGSGEPSSVVEPARSDPDRAGEPANPPVESEGSNLFGTCQVCGGEGYVEDDGSFVCENPECGESPDEAKPAEPVAADARWSWLVKVVADRTGRSAEDAEPLAASWLKMTGHDKRSIRSDTKWATISALCAKQDWEVFGQNKS